MRGLFNRPRRGRLPFALGVVIVAMLSGAIFAIASHGVASLPGSNFEIDNDANLKVDDPPDWTDWAGVTEVRKEDAPTGKNDDSYAGGAKEDDPCPGTTTGSIPNNKSDLLHFGVYEEPGDPGFLNLFWTRVNEPSGTTLMDFELNQSSTDCGNGVNNVRTEGDLLIEYRITQGGATASIKIREWTGSAWGPAEDITGDDATGTINSSPIPAAESDGLISEGSLSPRTFGEAQIDLDFIFDEDKCLSFGSAFLKSRASDSFTSQMKDYIAPVPISLTNCGAVIIRKQTDPADDETEFGFTKDFGTDPETDDQFTLKDGESKTFSNVLLGEGYTVSEDEVPAGWDLDEIDCDASEDVDFDVDGDTVTFDIDSQDDVLDCTFKNRARGSIVVEKVTNDGFGSFDFTSDTLDPDSFTLTTTAAGQAGKDDRTFSDLAPGTYDVAETVPAGWNLASATCDDGSDPASIGLSGGETVTCTFVNERQQGAILITKTRKHAAFGPGDWAHPGVDFTITGGSLPSGGTTVTTDANGEACVDGLVLSSFVGNYTVTETVPDGYAADGDTSKTVTVSEEATCEDGDPATVSFANTPLTDVSIDVTSQVDGGTKSTIDCGDEGDSGDFADPAELDLEDLEPGTYTCTIEIDP